MKSVFSLLAGIMFFWMVLIWLLSCEKSDTPHVATTPQHIAERTASYPISDSITVKTVIVKPIVTHRSFAGHDAVDITFDTSIAFGNQYVCTTIIIDHVPTAIQGHTPYYTQPNEVVNGLHVWSPQFDDNYGNPPMWTQFTNKGVIGLPYGILTNQVYTGMLIYYYFHPDTHYFSQPFQFNGPAY